MRKFLTLLAFWFAASVSHASLTFFDDEAAFLANAGVVTFDSFEDLATVAELATIQRADYVISSSVVGSGYGLYVWSGQTGFGAFPTDGTMHLGHQSNIGEVLRFDFDTPVTSFGLTLTDWDNPAGTDGAQLVFGDDSGNEMVILSSPMPEGSSLFFGVVNTGFAFSYVEFRNTASNEAFGFDGVYTSAPVPLPAAGWLLVSALFGLFYAGHHKKID